MKTFKAALQIILSESPTFSYEWVDLSYALGRVLGEDVCSKVSLPSFDNSAMDGFACYLIPGQKQYEIVGEVKAGDAPTINLLPGQAAAVMTGAPLPKGANTVIRIEDVERLAQMIQLRIQPNVGDHFRKRGEEIVEGEKVLKKGLLITPESIGLLAATGFSKAPAIQKPNIKILTTGNEIKEPGTLLKDGEIYNANGPMLRALLERDGATAELLPSVADDRNRLKEALRSALDCDVLVTCGGVSVGKYDFVREELESLGVQILFHQVAIKPGKPFLFGMSEKPKKTLVFGLPGNPVSTAVVYEMFIKPALCKMLGSSQPSHVQIQAQLEEPIEKKPGLTNFIRGVVRNENGEWKVRTTGPQGSHRITSMVQANALIVLNEDAGNLQKGENVQTILLGGQK